MDNLVSLGGFSILSKSFLERMNNMSPLRKREVSSTRHKHPKKKLRSRLGSQPLGFDQLEDRSLLSAGGLLPGAPVQNFIVNLYQDVLHRVPAAAEVNGWVQGIGNKTMDVNMRTQIATAFLNSTESFVDQIQADYMRFLHRAGDANGVAGWAAAMAHGLPELDLEMDFVASAEYSAMHPTNADFVSAVFHDVLGRTPTADNLTFFTNELQKSSRAQMAEQAILSTENIDNIITATVQKYLGRTPTAAELAQANQIIQGVAQGNNLQMEVAAEAQLLASDAFYHKMS
jgi:hypothetical protein